MIYVKIKLEGNKMQLQIDVNSVKSTIFLELLNLFKKDNMINDYKVINNEKNTYDISIIFTINTNGTRS